MARWLQSEGLQHLASPLLSTGIDQRLVPNLLVQRGREQSGASVSVTMDEDRFEVKAPLADFRLKPNSNQRPLDPEEKRQNVSPPLRKGSVDEKSEKPGNYVRKDGASNTSSSNSQQQSAGNGSTSAPKQYEAEVMDEDINAILEEMKLLAEVDQPGSLIDNYVTQLSFVLSRKAASLVGLQARLARFQHRLKEQEILSRKKDPW